MKEKVIDLKKLLSEVEPADDPSKLKGLMRRNSARRIHQRWSKEKGDKK